MLQQERHNQILARLNLEGQVRVKDLSKDFNVTEDCIRKDLNILEKANKLKRIHGGATCMRSNLHTVNVSQRRDVRVEEKRQLL
ncbi:DeoR family transcriptional regulator [Coprobacillaceae bacterium CR2/5/TPMF4]|nr:DeoR family transcriptional regulator [Coprobacillaceae bacterium CR2/5/TPMF4]